MTPRAVIRVAALVLALAAMVALASRGTPLWTPPREGHANRLEIVLTLGVLGGLCILAILAVTALVHRLLIAGRPGAPPLRATLLRATPALTALFAIASLLALATTDLGRGPVAGDDPSGVLLESTGRSGRPLVMELFGFGWVRAGEGAPDRELPEEGAPDPEGPWGVALIVLGVLAAALAGASAWGWYARRSDRAGDDDGTGTEGVDRAAVHGAVMGTIDAMLTDPDPRTAIIGAYARLLENLADCGAARRDPEAPMEHLRRVLGMRRVRPEPLRGLTELFTLARFSTHPLEASHRERALDALREVAADLGPGVVGPGVAADTGAGR